MAIIFEDNFDTGYLTYNTKVGDPFIQSTKKFGAYGLGASCNQQFNYLTKLFGATYTKIHMRAYVNATAYPTALDPTLGVSLLDISQNGVWGNNLFLFGITNPVGPTTYFSLASRHDAGFDNNIITSLPIVLNRWYCCEIQGIVNALGSFTVWIDGVQRLRVAGVDNTLFQANSTLFGNNYTPFPFAGFVYIDNLVIADDYIGLGTASMKSPHGEFGGWTKHTTHLLGDNSYIDEKITKNMVHHTQF